MLVWIFGVVLFAIGVGASIALHEAGHMWTAKAFGMKVRRFYIGFGPKIFSFRRGETEYGLKAIPAGGFCDIAGMTALDEVTPEEEPRAMWKYPAWKRIVVMSAGSGMHFILGFLILYLMAVSFGLPNTESRPVLAQVTCAAPTQDPVNFTVPECTSEDPRPAADAGIEPGDEVVAVAGKATPTWTDVTKAVRASSGPTELTVRHDGTDRTVTVDVPTVRRVVTDAKPGESNDLESVGALGVSLSPSLDYGPVAGAGATVVFTGEMFARTWQGLLAFPEKLPKVVQAIGGGERDPETPVSVVGASVIGGDAVERGLWSLFFLFLASLNFFVGVFNLLPLLPMDGGHIAITIYERIRNWIRTLRGRPIGAPVDYTKLLPLTMVIIVLGGAVVLLTVTADIVNPIRLPR